MIRVRRPLKMAPKSWLEKARKEAGDVIDAYKAAVQALRKSRKKDKELEFAFDFRAYSDDELKDTLRKVYRHKCAYCESSYGPTGPGAVEHYRPKGEVIEGTTRIKPGYYWLAAEWRNLLPSCTDCNSPRGQQMKEGEKKVTRGKSNYFPLAPGSKRAKKPGEEKKEKPLLLHPEIDDPDDHLEYALEPKREGIIRPKMRKGAESPRGVASIEVYALDRPELIKSRADVANRLRNHLLNTRYFEEEHRKDPANPRLKQMYEHNMKELVSSFLAEDQQYAAMARQIARAELPGLKV